MSACVSQPRQMTRATLHDLAVRHGYQDRALEAEGLPMISVVPTDIHRPVNVLRVYLEGDGLAWRSRRQVSDNPTPVTPVALQLMLADPNKDLAYLGRPCQFVHNGACRYSLWTSARFSQPVVSSLSSALSQLKQQFSVTSFQLVGYSGGGALALLLAVERDDVDSVITVAGNLETRRFAEYHHVSPLTESLNPADYVDVLSNIPQVHFVGSEDEIITDEISNAYVELFDDDSVRMINVADVGHLRGWVELWPQLLTQITSAELK